MSSDRLKALADAGVSIWLDDLNRRRLTSGGLAAMIRDKYVVGVTSNPTIFAAAVANASDYDDQVRELAARSASVEDIVRELTTADVRDACEEFRNVWQNTATVDGRVSLEVDPRLAHQAEPTCAEAADLWKTVDRPNLMIKIPATEAGLPAITATLADGISVNVTLIFSPARYRQVMDAFMAGLERAKANGHDLAPIGSVASFFVSRVDTEVDRRLDALNSTQAEALRGTAAVANAKLAYAAYQEAFDTDRWRALQRAGAKRQRPLWASTGTKDPTYSDTKYITELVVPGTVNTMPEKTLNAFADHGEVPGDAVTGTADDAQHIFDQLAEVGVDMDDVFDTLEREGVEKFERSWVELLDTVAEQVEALRG
ncbi:MAG TPA: transaldolase [Pseudonocardiaceae bacterium]|jgi:transaldolase